MFDVLCSHNGVLREMAPPPFWTSPTGCMPCQSRLLLSARRTYPSYPSMHPCHRRRYHRQRDLRFVLEPHSSRTSDMVDRPRRWRGGAGKGRSPGTLPHRCSWVATMILVAATRPPRTSRMRRLPKSIGRQSPEALARNRPRWA